MTGRLDVWAPLPPGTPLRRRAVGRPFPLDEPGVALVARARHAILLGVRALGLGPGDEVLVPAWHHGSEVEALLRAGVDVAFYETRASLAPDEDELDALAGPRARALYLVHYLGFPQDGRRWRRWCDGRGLFLLEDAAQAWLATGLGGPHPDGTPVGSHGDLAVFCLYKTYGLAEGAALVLRGGREVTSPRRSPETAASLRVLRRQASWLAARSTPFTALLGWARRLGPGQADDPAAEVSLGEPAGAARITTALLDRLPDDAAARRRAHYRLLLDELGDAVPTPFGQLPDGASPFAFPLATDRKVEVLDRLDAAGISGLDFWRDPHPALPVERFPEAAARRASTVLLPVHQELRPSDVERIAAAARGVGTRRSPRLDWLDDLDAARDDWRRLASASGNVFATWEWATTWWRHYGVDGALRLAALRGPGGVRALLPLVLWRRRPVCVLRFLGHCTADELGPICAAADRPAAARALRRALDESGADVLLGEHLPGGDTWAALLGGTVLRRERFPVLRAPDGWDAYLATRTGHARRKAAGEERRLVRDHDVQIRMARDPAGLGADLDVLFALHRARWPEGSEFLAHEAFHRDMATEALRQGWLRLWVLELDGVAAACWYGFRFAGVESHLQFGRDPRFARESVGSVLLLHTIRAALAEGVTEYRFLRGDEPYKRRFATDDPGIETVAVARGPGGRAALAGGRAADALTPVRRLVTARLRSEPEGP